MQVLLARGKHSAGGGAARVAAAVRVGPAGDTVLGLTSARRYSWRYSIGIGNAALALLMLLKPRFLAGRDFAECKHVGAPEHFCFFYD